jgi:SAM-dependent methyltransferase
MSDGFYRAFEEKHRGSREVIKERLRAYFPFFEPLAALHRGAQTVDLGCGRGEWLELMTEVGFSARGVDLDQGMLDGCIELGLPAEKGDALDFLAALPDKSQAIVSAFHMVEHITFEQLQTLVSEAFRVLKPGGLLIMETPNPENIIVATCNFYVDPTHQRPVPPELLSFLPEYYGFPRVKTIRLQESQRVAQSASLTLHDVLSGVSPDYAVVAQKGAIESIFQKFDAAFDREFGLSMAVLAARYELQAEARALELSERATQAEARAVHASERATQAEGRALQASERATQAEARALQSSERAPQAESRARQAGERATQAEARAEQATERAAQAEARAQQLRKALDAVADSRSWRLTAPLRWVGLQARRLGEWGFLIRGKLIHPVGSRGIASVSARPILLRHRAVALAQHVGFYGVMRTIYRRLSGHSLPIRASSDIDQPDELSQLTSRARAIYQALKIAIKTK